MRILVFIFSFLLVASTTDAQRYTIVGFYNLENLFDTVDHPKKRDEDFTPNGKNANTEAVFRKKLKNLAHVISLLGIEKNEDGPALLGVAEIENRFVLEELVKEPKIAKRNYKIVHFESPDLRGIDVGLLYNPKYFRVLAAKSLPVSLARLGDTYPTRDVLWVKGKLRGETVHVFVNHWPSRRGGEAATREKRKEAARVCKSVIDSLRQSNPDIKTIVMGDLNDDPINASVTEVLQATGKIKKLTPEKMYNPWMKYFKQGIGTIAWQDAWGLFDQIILSPNWVSKKGEGLKYSHAEVFNRGFLIQKTGKYKGYPMRSFTWGKWNDGYSDHFPTMIYLK